MEAQLRALVLRLLDEQCRSGACGSPVVTAAHGPLLRHCCGKGMPKVSPRARSRSGLLNALMGSVGPLIAFMCILLLFHLQFLPTYFKNM